VPTASVLASSRLPAILAAVVAVAALGPQSLHAETEREATASIALPIAHIERRLAGPLEVVDSRQARPKIAGDRSAKVLLAGGPGEPEMAARWKPVSPPGHGFNNEPRYELAAYQLQKLFLEECEYVVPPVVLRALPLQEHQRLRPDDPPTVKGTSSVLFLLSYWLNDVTNAEPWNPARFDADPRYARHWGNLNILTHLIDHKDANIGNLLVSRQQDDPRVFSVDNDVAFRSTESERGATWGRLLINRLPQATLERLRKLTEADLEQKLGVLAEFTVEDGLLVAVDPGKNLGPGRGMRNKAGRVQFGLTASEIRDVKRRIALLLAKVDSGRIRTDSDRPESLGLACHGATAAAARP
jgi:hypothetical protein